MTGFGVLVRKELIEQWRTLRLPIVAGLFLVIGIASPLLAKYMRELVESLAGDIGIPIPEPTTADAVDQLLKNLGQFGALAAILLAMGSVATEKERGTAALLLTKPLDRAAFIAAKLAALGATLVVSTALAIAAGWIYIAILFEPPSIVGFVEMGVLVALSLLAYGAITFLFSAVTRSALAAGGIGFVALLVLGIFSAFPSASRFLPAGLNTPARALALGQAADVAIPIASAIVLIGACGLLAWVSFRRQEL